MGIKKKYLKVFRASLLGTGVIAIGGVSFFGTDWLVSKFIGRYQSQLEQELTEKLGHSLSIGKYKGLSFLGVSFGTTKLLPAKKDQSTVEASSINLQLAPIASFFNRRAIVILSLNEAKFNLKRNQSGSYWIFGSLRDNRPRNLEIMFRLNDPAKVFIEPANLLVNTTGELSLNLSSSKAKGSLAFDFPDYGAFTLAGRGNWNEIDFQTKLDFQGFDLKPLESFLPSQLKFETGGIANGDLQLGIKQGSLKCKGKIAVTDLNFKGGLFDKQITSKKTGLNCRNNSLKLPLTKFKYGLWSGNLEGEIPLKDPENLNLGLSTELSHADQKNTSITLDAELPFVLDKQKLIPGFLTAKYKIDSYPLTSLSSIINQSISGNLSATGNLQGLLSSLTTDFSFSLDNPQISRIRLQEKWQGRFFGSSGGGGRLQMQSIGAALPSTISAKLRENWGLENLFIKRLGGNILLRREDEQYKWTAENFRLDRIEVAIPPEKSYKRIFGQFSGEGGIDLDPFIIDGKLSLGYPRVMGVKLRQAQFVGSYSGKNYSFQGDLFPLDSGQITINAKGSVDGALKTKTQLKRVSPSWLIKSALQLPKVNIETPLPSGTAEDLGSFVIRPNEESLDSQIREWIRSVISVSKDRQSQNKKEIIDPNHIRGYVDAVIEIQGSDLEQLTMDLKASGKLWTKNQNTNEGIDIKPFTATIKGPLTLGDGEFSFVNIPFSLFSLFIPSPSGLTGMFGLTGKYRLGSRRPEVTADLVFNQVGLGKESIVLNRGKISFSESIVELNIALQSTSSSNPVTIAGQIPLMSTLPIDLRVESHGDGISFLDDFFDGDLIWNKGSADLRLLVTGTIDKPFANGFLVLQNGELVVNERIVKDINGTMVFDFNRVEVLNLGARVGSGGRINGNGNIALFRAEELEKNPLSIKANDVRIRSSFADIDMTTNLLIRGSLINPVIGGEAIVSKGSISTQRRASQKLIESKKLKDTKTYKATSFPEQKWNRKSPLVLFIRDENAPASKMINSAIPKGLSNVSFDELRLKLGPRLRIISPPVTSFEIDGSLILNGDLDQELSASGLVRLLNGRVNLFTTTFILDRREPNVAIFVPSMGLLPYVDVKLTTRVPDTVRDPNDLNSSSDFNKNGSGTFGIGGSRFVKVEVIATGPADRLKDNYQLRSTPPIPENELLGLIGGNSLANLFEGRDSTVFADVLNRSLITPVLGNISGALSERLQIALYPAYVNAAVSDPETIDNQSASSSEENRGELSPEQAWVTEVGIDLTDRLTFSVQATPNRDDIAPQGNLTFQLNQNFGVLGSFDKNGNWQSQLEIFIRY